MRVILITALCLLVAHVAAFVVVSPATQQHRSGVVALPMASTEEDTKPAVDATSTADASAEEESEPVAVSKWASESSVQTDKRYEENEDDSPLMKAGKALKPLNDVIETITSSPLLGPVLFLAPILGSPKVRAEIAHFFSSLGDTQ
mmetsp:Transcript_12978/g.26841  ORF Transcript_12978/g.26841 Transcript_12978/m.26841 type:complete len:146 (+) Transcript_12978:310-747(+)